MPKKYIPNDKEKYMCARQKAYFKKRLIEWRKEIIEINNKSLYLNDIDHEILNVPGALEIPTAINLIHGEPVIIKLNY